MRPHLGQVERVEVIGLGVHLGHDLHADAPLRVIAAGDGVKQIGGRVIRVLASQPDRFRAGVVLDPLPGQAVEFHPEPCASRIDEAEGVAGEAMHVAMALGRAAIAEQDGDLVEGFR